ncbi:tol-pal system protein YbgF [Lysobacter brunescens]|uniref:Cell division coordinator CpoB n=1 Tax=Lysobacter brunescens TaxID=262323 RepID=A0ABW2YBJ8_9GAMM
MNLRRIPLIAAFLFACLLVAPAHAQRVSTADRLAALEQQLSAMRSGNLDLLNQIGELKSEVQAQRAQIEELQQKLEQQTQSGRSQYLDLDSRLERLESGAAGPSTPTTDTPAIGATPATPARPAAAPASPAPAVPAYQDTPPRVYGDAATLGTGVDERNAYNAAFETLKGGRYADAARQFQAFLDRHPAGTYAPNAMYWLGESYYVTQNYALAQEQFQGLLDRYPTHDKAAGALLKVGLCQQGLRQLDAAEASYNQVLGRYPGTEAARVADDRLRAIQLLKVR